ncbi:MAG: WYL domain-containing transcriptional regulator [Polyangiaceae bacterium]|nr:WYL domain-containing transcriptional regulator [Polyangiaceae bacterium]
MPNSPGRPAGRFTQHRRVEAITRLFEQTPRGLTLYELADALDVTARSMRRYISELRRELDLQPTRERGGGVVRWRMGPTAQPRKIELRRTQAYALLAARRMFEPMKGSTLYEEIDIAIQRLVSVARRPGRGPNAGVADARLEDRFLFLPHTPKDYAKKTDELDTLFQAVADLRPLECRYRSTRDKTDERVVIHPYAMVVYKEAVYCVGLHTGKREVRTFLLDRMSDAECATTERFSLPDDFHIEDYFEGQFGVFRGSKQIKVVIDFAPHVAEYVRSRKVHASQRLTTLPDGGVRLTLTVSDTTEIGSWVLGWGETATVVAPPALVDSVSSTLRKALARYKKKPASG